MQKKIAQVRTIDDGFQFYEALLTLDLSDNMIETIQDGAFQSQVIFVVQSMVVKPLFFSCEIFLMFPFLLFVPNTI